MYNRYKQNSQTLLQKKTLIETHFLYYVFPSRWFNYSDFHCIVSTTSGFHRTTNVQCGCILSCLYTNGRVREVGKGWEK